MKLSDVVDITRLKGLAKSFEAAFGIPCDILDAGEDVLSAERTTACREVYARGMGHAGECDARRTSIQSKIESGKAVTSLCPLGLSDIVLPVFIEDNYAGSVVIGQFLTEVEPEEKQRARARELSIPEDEFLELWSSFPVVDPSRLPAIGAFFEELAGLITALGHENVHLMAAEQELRILGETLEQKVLERTRKLEESENRLKDAQHIGKMGSFLRDFDPPQCWWSDELYRLLGLTPNEKSCGEDLFFQFIHPDDLAGYKEAWARELARSSNFSLDVRIVTKQGEIRWLTGHYFVDKDDFGRPLRCRGAFRDISERKAIEHELIRVNNLQKVMLDNSILGISIVKDRKFQWVNHRSAEMTGYETPELLGKPTKILFLDKDRFEAFGEFARRAIESGHTYDAVHQFVKKDGSELWCRTVGNTLDPNKPEEGVIWFFEDITERRKTELALNKNRLELESIFNNSRTGILLLRDTRRIARANQRMADILGYDTPEEMMEKDVRIIHLSDKQFLDFGENHFFPLAHGEQMQIQYELRKKDGSQIWCSLSGKALDANTPADLSKGSIWIIDDISQFKDAEKALRNSERRFRAIFAHAGVGICTLNKEGVIQRVNHRMCMFVDYSEYDLLGMNISDVTHEKDRSSDSELASRLWMGDIPMFVREKRFIRRDGNEVWGKVTTTIVKDDNKAPQYILQVVEDTTERKRLEAELVRLARTDPLTGVSNRLSFMERGNEEFQRFKRYGTQACVMLLDIDHFKQINDKYGHQSGDTVLKRFAKACVEQLRQTDIFGRLGGEEFAAVLVETDFEHATEAAERVRQKIEAMVVALPEEDIRLSVSIGITAIAKDDEDLEATIHRADGLMYEAKNQGRNRVISD